MPKIIKVSEFEIEVTRKKMKNLRLRVTKEGKICISAPKSVSEKAIINFVQSHLSWIRKAVTKASEAQKAYNSDYLQGEPFYFFGSKYIIEEKEGVKKSLSLEDGKAVLILPESTDLSARKRFVDQWYKERLKEEIPALLEKWENITSLSCSSWQVRDMTSRWGSCSINSKSIRLNLQLVKRPKICLEYVILHELAHTKAAGHGEDFKKILDSFMPDWREIKKLLNDFQS